MMTIPEQKKPAALPMAEIIMPTASGPEELPFAGIPKGANASALLFTMVETAKANEIDQQALLKFLFERFPAAQPPEDIRALMPQHVDKFLLPSLHSLSPSRARNRTPASSQIMHNRGRFGCLSAYQIPKNACSASFPVHV